MNKKKILEHIENCNKEKNCTIDNILVKKYSNNGKWCPTVVFRDSYNILTFCFIDDLDNISYPLEKKFQTVKGAVKFGKKLSELTSLPLFCSVSYMNHPDIGILNVKGD